MIRYSFVERRNQLGHDAFPLSLHRGAKPGRFLDIYLYIFPRVREWVSEQASELLSAAERAREASSAEQANE